MVWNYMSRGAQLASINKVFLVPLLGFNKNVDTQAFGLLLHIMQTTRHVRHNLE